MKTFINERLGFKMDVPENWALPAFEATQTPFGETIDFGCEYFESFSLLVSRVDPEQSLEQTENEFRQVAQRSGYTSLIFGRLSFAGKEHIWARYYLGGGKWSKNYFIMLHGIAYTISAFCFYQNRLLEREQVWDTVVASFRLLRHISWTPHFGAESGEPKGGIPIQLGGASSEQTARPAAQKKPTGLKTYRNEKHGFEIDLPQAWAPAPEIPPGLLDAIAEPLPPGLSKDCFQYGCYDEAINFEIAPLSPEPRLEDTEVEFKIYANDHKYADLHFGRISVAGKQHVWASYFINDQLGQRWNKKYMLVFGGIEYALTVTCNEPEWFARRERDWDALIQTFHVLTPGDESANAGASAEKERQKRRGYIQERIEMREKSGEPYARAYEAFAMGQTAIAQALLEECLRDEPNHIQAKQLLAVVKQKIPGRPERPSPGSNRLEKVEAGPNQNGTLAFSIRAYLFIEAIALFYIAFTVGFKPLLSLTSADHQPLSTGAFYLLEVVIFFGIGALVCEFFLLGVAFNEDLWTGNVLTFDFIKRTMLIGDNPMVTVGERTFSDYTRLARGNLDGMGLQIAALFHALIKIILLPLHLVYLNRVLILVFIALPFLANMINKQPLPVIWEAGYLLILNFICYRAFLDQTARRRGVGKTREIIGNRQVALDPSLEARIKSAATQGLTPELITEILCQDRILNAIQNDLMKTGQLGYREMWRLGLVTPNQDTYYPPAAQPSRQETIQKLIQDPNYRLNLAEQIPLDKTAILNHIGTFNIQNNGLVVTWGTAEARQRGRPGKIYPLQTVLNEHEFINIRNIQMADQRTVAEHRSRSLPNFLQEEGFPLKGNYAEADPLTTERGGIIVLDKGKIRIIYPQYFVQRSLIDDEGSLIYLGQDESFSLVTMFEVKMRPSLAESLLRNVQANGYFPILRYRSVPYAGDFMLPILDTPMSANGWADLFIDAGGYANLFVAKEKTQAEWFEMMNRLKTLFFGELAKKGYHLLGLTKDKAHLSRYLAEKQQILADYFIIRSLKLF